MPRLTKTHLPEQKIAFGKSLKEAREEAKLSRTQVAESLGVTPAYLSLLENGHNVPSQERLILLENILHVPDGHFFSLLSEQSPTINTRQQHIEKQAGTARVYEEVPVREGLLTAQLANSIWKSREGIDILDNWIGEDLRRMEGQMRAAITRGVKIRIVLLHPNQANRRSENITFEILNRQTYGQQIVCLNLKTLSDWYISWRDNWRTYQEERIKEIGEGSSLTPLPDWNKLQIKDRFEVRLIHSIPSVQYYRFDRVRYVGFFTFIQQSRFGPQLEINLYREQEDESKPQIRTILARTFADEFEAIWTATSDQAYYPEPYDLEKGIEQLGVLNN
jgi:transcriptional regulator with XRE-family HTH domain